MKSFSVEFGQRSLSWKILWKFLHASSVSLLFFRCTLTRFLEHMWILFKQVNIWSFKCLYFIPASRHLRISCRNEIWLSYISLLCATQKDVVKACDFQNTFWGFAKETSSIKLSVFPFFALPFKNMLHKLLKKSHFKDNINKK